MRVLSFAVLLSLLPLGLLAANSADVESKLEEVRAEVSAARLIREHEYGGKKASEADLAAARLVLRNRAERQARAVVGGSAQEFRLDSKDLPVTALIPICAGVLGYPVVVDDALKGKIVSITASDPALEPFRAKFKEELKRNGIGILFMPGDPILCPLTDPRLQRQLNGVGAPKGKAPAR